MPNYTDATTNIYLLTGSARNPYDKIAELEQHLREAKSELARMQAIVMNPTAKSTPMGSTPPIPVMADRCPECGEIKLRPGDGTERHGSNAHSPWTCVRCGYWWVDPDGHLNTE